MTTMVTGTYEQDDLIRSEPDEFHLACVLLSPTCTSYLEDTLRRLEPTDFYDNALGEIWGLARRVHARGQRVTKRTLLIEAETVAAGSVVPRIPPGHLMTWLERCAGQPGYPDRIPGSVAEVQRTAQLRRLVLAAEQIKHQAVGARDFQQAFGWAVSTLQGLDVVDTPDEVIPFSVLVDEFHQTMAGGRPAGRVVPSPWVDLNDVLGGGFHAGRLYVVAAKPGAGKTNLALNVAAHAAELGSRALMVSAEMSGFEVAGRLLAAGGRAEYGEITRYAMSQETRTRVREYGERYRGMPLGVIDRSGMTIEEIASVARVVKKQDGLDLLVLDYLQLIEASDTRMTRERQVAHISRSAKLLAKELGCSVLFAAQLNRENVKANRRPVLDDIRESGAPGQDSDGVILLHHERTDDDYPTGEVTLIVAKNRFGRCADVVLPWKAYYARIGD